MYRFIVGVHKITHQPMVEFFQNGVLMACIYPHEDGLHIVSKYLSRVTDPKDNDYTDCFVVLK